MATSNINNELKLLKCKDGSASLQLNVFSGTCLDVVSKTRSVPKESFIHPRVRSGKNSLFRIRTHSRDVSKFSTSKLGVVVRCAMPIRWTSGSVQKSGTFFEKPKTSWTWSMNPHKSTLSWIRYDFVVKNLSKCIFPIRNSLKTPKNYLLSCESKIVAFIIKNIDTIIFFHV